MKIMMNKDNDEKGIRYELDLHYLTMTVEVSDLFNNPLFRKQLAACRKLTKLRNKKK